MKKEKQILGKSREQRLVEAFGALRRERFDWGEFNCGFAAATLAEAYCGVDYAAEFRPFVSGPLSAMRLVAEAGGLAALVDGLGLERCGVAEARRGDAVLLAWTNERGKRREALGIVIDDRAAFSNRDGLRLIRARECEVAWRLPLGRDD